MGAELHATLIAVGCAAATWLLLAIAMRTRLTGLALDEPNERSLHAAPTPRIGGLALVSVAGAAVLVFAPAMRAAFVVALVLMVVSALDDRRGLPIVVRFGIHIAAGVAAALLVLGGSSDAWAYAAFVLTVAWAINLYNFMDGADGLAGGMALFGFGTYALVAAGAEAWPLTLACTAVAAAAAGFLAHNLPPARLFLGDAGSVPLGFLAAVIGSLGWRGGLWPWTFPLLVFAPFVVDATLTLVRRVLRGEPVWRAHREHLYQRMVLQGLGHRGTAIVWYVAMAMASMLATWSISWPMTAQIALLGGAVALYAMAFLLVRGRRPVPR
jgi:UDP-N-acetylmuramyl pentapeptide phosphotransferase/UDP-N-acetylglucosamine-1-phosphate transferase